MQEQAARSPDWTIFLRLTQARLTLILWVTAAFMELAIDFAGGATFATVLRVSATYTFGFTLSLAAGRLALRQGACVTSFSFARILGYAIPCGAAMFIVDVFGRAFEHGSSPITAWPIDFVLRTRVNLAYFTVLFVFQAAVSWLCASARALAKRDRELAEAQIMALRLQLNPHFLSNTLNSIATLVSEAGSADAEFMILRLSEFLEATLATDPTMLVPLAVELDLVQAYLDIEAVRFGERLRVNCTCGPRLSEIKVPHFILQPLVENAIKHAVSHSTDPVTVSVEAMADQGHILLKVRDDGPTKPKAAISRRGVGLRNVADRLHAIYGSDGELETVHNVAGGFVATVRIPLSRFASPGAAK